MPLGFSETDGHGRHHNRHAKRDAPNELFVAAKKRNGCDNTQQAPRDNEPVRQLVPFQGFQANGTGDNSSHKPGRKLDPLKPGETVAASRASITDQKAHTISVLTEPFCSLLPGKATLSKPSRKRRIGKSSRRLKCLSAGGAYFVGAQRSNAFCCFRAEALQ
jgi:hypothetical protein